MSHADLVTRAGRWLRGSQRCPVVIEEFYWLSGECPDALGWRADGRSILVECKASKSDFYADRSKTWRRVPGIGLGQERYYMTPKGLVRPEQVPDGWGLLEVCGKVIRKRKPATPFNSDERLRREMKLLVNLNGRQARSLEFARTTTEKPE